MLTAIPKALVGSLRRVKPSKYLNAESAWGYYPANGEASLAAFRHFRFRDMAVYPVKSARIFRFHDGVQTTSSNVITGSFPTSRQSGRHDAADVSFVLPFY